MRADSIAGEYSDEAAKSPKKSSSSKSVEGETTEGGAEEGVEL